MFPKNAETGNFWDDNSPDPKVPRGTFVRPICMPDPDKLRQVKIRTLHPWTFKKAMTGNKDDVWITGFGNVNGISLKQTLNSAYSGIIPSSSHWGGESGQLMKAQIAAMRKAECQKRLRNRSGIDLVISWKQMCAMGTPNYQRNPEVDTCLGDSGGPAVKMVDNFKERAIREKWTKDERNEAYMEMIMSTDDYGVPPLRGQLLGVSSWVYGCGEGTPGVYTKVSKYLTWIKKYTDELSTTEDNVF